MIKISNSFRPREKMIARGADALSNTELVALLLGSGVKERDVMSIASHLMREIGAKRLAASTFEDLCREKGVGNARACVILAAIELGRRLFEKPDENGVFFDGPDSVVRFTRDLSQLKKEHFIALCLNAKNQLIKRETISVGSLFSNMVHPRDVFVPALEANAAALILVHNHPSGDPEPSPQDRALTNRLVEAGKLLGIDVLDHVIVGRGSFVSFESRAWI